MFSIVYLAGFLTTEPGIDIDDLWQIRLGLSVLFCIVVAYATILFEKIEFTNLKKLFENNNFLSLSFAKDVPTFCLRQHCLFCF